MNEQTKIWGRLLKETRRDKNWTIKDLSEVSRVPMSSISAYENGREMGIDNAVRLCLALECSLDYIFLDMVGRGYKPVPVYQFLKKI